MIGNRQQISRGVKRGRAIKRESLPRAIFISAICHALLILLFTVLPGGWFVNLKRPMEITWVELPKGGGEDIYGVKKVERLPETTPQDKIAATSEPPSTVQPPPPTKDIKPIEEDRGMKEPVEKPPKETQKQPAKKQMTREQLALAKIEERLKNRKTPEAAQVDSSGEGYIYGTSDKPNRVPVTDPEYLKYQALVRSKILSQWIVPGSVTQLSPSDRPIVQIIVYIDKSGYVISKVWAKKSSLEALNASAMRAIERASPFPVPPDRLKWEAYNEGFLVEFNPRRQ
jgi:outer membrane biosynthesis protein TonB